MLPIFIYFAILIAAIIAVSRHPSIAIAMILCMYGLEQWAQSAHPFFSTYHQLTNLAVGSIVVLGLTVQFMRKKPIFSGYSLSGWLTIFLFIYALISILWSPISGLALNIWSGQWPYLLTLVMLSPLLISSPESLRIGLMGLLPVGTLLILLLLFYSHWTFRGVELAEQGGRTVMGNPLAVSEMAAYLMLCVVLLHFNGMSRIWQYGRWFIAGCCLVLAVKSGSRGQFFTMLVIGVLFLPFSRTIRNPLQLIVLLIGMLLLGGMGILALDYFSPAGGARWLSSRMESDIAGRFDNALRLLHHWSQSPLTMLFGLGNTASYDPGIIGFYPHIVPLEILGEEGILGFSIYIGIIILSFRSLIRTRKLIVKNKSQLGALAALGAMFVFQLVISLKQGSMLYSAYLFTFSVMIGKYEEVIRKELRHSMATKNSMPPDQMLQARNHGRIIHHMDKT